jgi:hypothetical protein
MTGVDIVGLGRFYQYRTKQFAVEVMTVSIFMITVDYTP